MIDTQTTEPPYIANTETILLTFAGLDAGTVTADEIEQWYAVAGRIHREALAAHDAPVTGGQDERP